MISGDMRKTAEAVALEVGLIKEEDLPKSEYVVMDA
jgi:magnesium-transporting ATPase (P-type)